MRKLLAATLAAATMSWASLTSAALISFDDLDASAADLDIGGVAAYQGFTWKNFFAYTVLPGFDGFNNGIVSPQNAAYSGGEFAADGVMPIVGSISAAALFDFTSAALGAGWYDGLALTVQGSRAGQTLFSQTVAVGTSGAQLFQFNFSGIDTLSFLTAATGATLDPFLCGSFNCTQFTIDDLTIGSAGGGPGPVAVNDTSSVVLMLVAGTFLPWMRRRQARSAPPRR